MPVNLHPLSPLFCIWFILTYKVTETPSRNKMAASCEFTICCYQNIQHVFIERRNVSICAADCNGYHAVNELHFDSEYCISQQVEFYVVQLVVRKITTFWDVGPCGLLKVNQRFGGTYRLHFQHYMDYSSLQPTRQQYTSYLSNSYKHEFSIQR
jgi:hypothetical protein